MVDAGVTYPKTCPDRDRRTKRLLYRRPAFEFRNPQEAVANAGVAMNVADAAGILAIAVLYASPTNSRLPTNIVEF